MVSVEPIGNDPVDPDPISVLDRQLWRDAQVVLNHHVPTPGEERCSACGRAWPCIARRTGERAQVAAFEPWNVVWTARHDLQSATALSGWCGPAGWRARRLSTTRNRGILV